MSYDVLLQDMMDDWQKMSDGIPTTSSVILCEDEVPEMDPKKHI